MHNGDVFPFFQNFNRRLKDKFKGSNKLLVEMQIYFDDNPIGQIIKERYLSGEQKKIKQIFGNNLPEFFREPLNYANYDIFKTKAIDINGRTRLDDTELKFIFNFLEEHWNKGNRFVINMESTLYTCTSCQSYLVYLKELARQEGKIIDITVISHKGATSTNEIETAIENL